MVDFSDEFAVPADYARLYRAKGLQIVPAFMPTEVKQGQSYKRPLLKTWVEYQEALVPDEVFAPWYGPGGLYVNRPNMGLITGRASGGLFVIDLDWHRHPEARAWWHDLMEEWNNGLDLETVEQITGGGGCQKLFRAPPGRVVGTSAGKVAIGVDIRGQGGFAMLAPSLHDSGRRYEWKEGCAPDEIEIAEAPGWLLDAVDALIAQYGGTTGQTRKPNGQTSQADYDAFGHQTGGREGYMRDMVWRVVCDWSLTCPIKPTEAESAHKAQQEYEVYERKVNPQRPHPADLTKTQMLDREGRGWTEWWGKWQRAMRKWDSDVYTAARDPNRPKPDDVSHETYYGDEFARAKATGQTYPFIDASQIMAMPDPVWMVEDLIPERALGFVFGPPGSLKTFIALDLALSTAAKMATFWGRKINSPGAVIYLCREGVRSLKFRLKAWEIHRQAKLAGSPFYLIEAPINFMSGADVGVLLATVEAVAAKAGVPIAAIFVDTVSRVLPGAKENQQEDMSLFVGACEVLQSKFQCIVVGVHHTNKNGGIRGSTVIPGAGDFLIETRREPGAMTGSIVLQKVKDGEDGQELPFKVTKVDLPGIVPRSSLMVDPDGAAKVSPQPSGDGLPDIIVCREILAALAQAWFNKMPWGKGANSDRPALIMIMNRWMVKRDVAKRLMDGWLANGVIEYDYFDKRNKLRGYRKITDL